MSDSFGGSTVDKDAGKLAQVLVIEEAHEGLLYLRNPSTSDVVVDAVRVIDEQGRLLVFKKLSNQLVIPPGEVRALRVSPDVVPAPLLEHGAAVILGGPASPTVASYNKPENLAHGVGGEYKGLNYFYWSKAELDEALDDVPGLGLYQAQVDFRHAKTLGFTHVFIPVFVNQTTATSNDPQINTPRFGTDYLSPTGNLSRLIQVAQEEGLEVCLRVFATYGDWGWRGDINPSDPSTWFTNYRTAVDQVLELAERESVECIEIASEMSSMYTASLDPMWRDLLEHAKDRMPESVVFITLNFYDLEEKGILGTPNDPMRKTLEASHVIGLSAYFNLTTPSGTNDLNTALAAWKGANPYSLNYYEMLANLSRGYNGKTILFTEVGYRSIDGAGYTPWDHTTDTTKPQDLEEQAVMIEAFLKTYRELVFSHAAASGYALWGAEVGLPYKWDGYDVFAKPAASVLAKYHDGKDALGVLYFIMPPPPSTSDANLYYGYWMIRSSEYSIQPTFSDTLSFTTNLSIVELPASSSIEVAKLVLSDTGTATVELETDSSGQLYRVTMKTSYDGWNYVYQDIGPYALPLNQQLIINITYQASTGTILWKVNIGSSLVASRTYNSAPTGLEMDSAYMLDYNTPRPLKVGVLDTRIIMDDKEVLRGSLFYHTGFKEVYTLGSNTAQVFFEQK